MGKWTGKATGKDKGKSKATNGKSKATKGKSKATKGKSKANKGKGKGVQAIQGKGKGKGVQGIESLMYRHNTKSMVDQALEFADHAYNILDAALTERTFKKINAEEARDVLECVLLELRPLSVMLSS